jgi:hypothetical protein
LEVSLIARILGAVVPGATFIVLATTVATFARATTQQSLSPQATAAPAARPKAYVLPDTLSPQSHPAPTATPAAGQLKFSGRLRAYDFQRLDRVQNASNPNRHAFELGAQPHLDYRFAGSNFNLGYTYGAATPFGFNGPNPIANPNVDNTVPGYPINSPIHELYLQYKDARYTVTAGDQELNYPWTPNSDSRIMPAAYQGIDSSFALSPTLTFGLTRIVRFEQRNSSNFVDNTLLTAPYPGASSLYKGAGTETPGTLRVGLLFKPVSNVSVLAENYSIYDIANLAYAEAKVGLAPRQPANPYLAVQYVAEGSLGQNQIGRVDNHTLGAQLGVNVAKGLLLAVSTDVSPWHYAYVNATSTTTATKGYFVGGGGTGDSVLVSPGVYKVAYGGPASPYTDSLGTDPLYTTMITQGMADRRSAGNSYKTALVYTSPSKQFKMIAAEAWFQYSNDISQNLTSEFNVDGTYYFNKVRPGPYKGFFVRVRIAPRNQPTLPYRFEYQRFITEYDF